MQLEWLLETGLAVAVGVHFPPVLGSGVLLVYSPVAEES